MDNKDHIRQIDFDLIDDNGEVDYLDGDIAFQSYFRELPIENGLIRVNMFTIVTCRNGKLQVELNTVVYILRPNEVLICRPNDVINNWMPSPDFDGAVLCLSPRWILEHVSESELWEKFFHLAENPVIRVREETLNMFKLYGALLTTKIKMERTPFYREIIALTVKAGLYELLSNVENGSASYVRGLTNQREVLFKRFIDLLSSIRIKPRKLSWYAEKLCVTPKYLSTVCKQVSGKTAIDWINEYILVDIRFWLKNTDKTISEIAYLLKFPNISFFGKYCRTHFGVSPTEYREQLRNISTENQARLK